MISQIKTLSRGAMQLLIESRFQDDFVKRFNRLFVISIINSGDKCLFQPDDDTALTLEFDDIEVSNTRDADLLKTAGRKLFEPVHVAGIDAFLKKIGQVPGNNLLMVHCSAGVSRSGAVAIYACETFNIDCYIFLSGNIHINPNKWVLKLFWIDANHWNDLNIAARKKLRQKALL